jgi:hypothetical protein
MFSKKALRVQNKQRQAYRGNDWPSGADGRGDTIKCPWMSQRSGRICNVVQRVRGGFRVKPMRFRIQRNSLLEETNRQVIAMRLSRIHSRGIGYLHSYSRLKCT